MKRVALAWIALVAVVFALVALPGTGAGRRLLSWVAGAAAADPTISGATTPGTRRAPAAARRPLLRVAIGAMITPERTIHWYEGLFDYVARAEGRSLKLVQRPAYAGVNRLLERGEVDLAWICTGAAWKLRDDSGAAPSVVPVVRGSDEYFSYFVVRAESPVDSIDDLAGRTVALVDPLSLTGRKVLWDELARRGLDPGGFLGRTYYTHGHDFSIRAVQHRLADAAFVDSLVYDDLAVRDPEAIEGTRVVTRYGPFPIPPIVLSPTLDSGEREQLVHVLTNMHRDPEGRRLLEQLRIDRFERADPGRYRQR